METYYNVPGGKVEKPWDPEKMGDLSNYKYMRGIVLEAWARESLVQHLTDCTGQTEP